MRFLYFIEGLNGKPSRDQIRAAGLQYALPDDQLAARQVLGGDLGVGTLLAYGDGLGLEHNPKTHDWRKIRAGVWIGIPRDKAQRPGPNDLAKQNMSLDGHLVSLADGRQWIVPIVRFLDGNTQLPRVLTRVHGHAKWIVKEEFAELVSMADAIVKSALSEAETNFDPDSVLRFCALALSVNYRVGPEEIAALELIDSENIKSIADAALDGPRLAGLVDEFKKKRIAQSDGGAISEVGVNV